MSESATQAAGPSLEQLLFRAMDRAAEAPALLDVEEFAARIAGPLVQSTSSERWVDRFFAGNVELREIVAPDLTHTTPRPYSPAALHVYEFDLDHLEYVVLEEDDQFLVVSESGQFSLPAEAAAKRAIESAAVQSKEVATEQPRAWLVRKDGGLEPLHPGKLARALSGSSLKQVSLQAVARPAARLTRWSPRRTELTRERAGRARRENEGRRLLGLAAPAGALGGGADSATDEEQAGSAEPTVFVLLPDGTLAQPQIGSATRWSEMVSGWVVRGGLLSAGRDQKRVSGSQRYTVSAGKVTAVFTSSAAALAPGDVGNSAAASADALSLVRADFAPVRVLGDEDLASAIVSGNTQVVAGWKGTFANVAAGGAGFWIQPESYFAPSDAERQLVARSDAASGLEAPSTGDEPPPSPGVAEGRTGLQPPSGEPVPAISAPEQVLVQPEPPGPPIASPEPVALPEPPSIPATAPIRAAFPVPPSPGALLPPPAMPPGLPAQVTVPPTFAPALPSLSPVARVPLAPLAGALPPTAFEALRLSIERTAAAGAHRIPLRSPPLLDRPPRQAKTPLRPWRRPLGPRPDRPLGRVLVSMPFPNVGEVHVGHDLSHALHALLAAPMAPLAAVPAPAGTIATGGDRRRHSLAMMSARRAALRLGIPQVGEILSTQQAASLRLLPPLLRHALRAGGEWVPGPGAPMPPEVRAFAAHGSFAVPEVLFAHESVELPAVEPARRPLGVGEDEIVVPTPLWTEMGRGSIATARHLISSPIARSSYTPALGSYRLLVPPSSSTLADKHETAPGSFEIAGPAAVRLGQARGTLQAQGEAGHFVLRPEAHEDAQPQRRGRIRVGAPLVHRTAAPSVRAPLREDSRRSVPPMRQEPLAKLPWPVEGTIVSPAPGVRPMSSALQEAVRISRDLAAPPPAPTVAKTFSRGTIDRVGPPPRSASAAIEPAQPVSAARATTVDEIAIGAQAGPGAVALSSWQTYAGDWDSGGRRTFLGAPRVAAWTYVGAEQRPASRTLEGAALQRAPAPAPGSLPTGLRFRYVSAPLWWSPSLRSPRAVASEEPGNADAQRSLRVALGASNLSGSLWRSILSTSGERGVDFSAGMDRGHDAPARELSGVSRRLDVLVRLGLVGKAAATDLIPPVVRGPETVYLAIDEQGRAGPIAPDQLRQARSLAQSVDMRVVTALPPSPPPLESMSAMRGIPDAEAPRARHPQAKAQEDRPDEAVSHSKIEGSVEAVAQRIYHRVRRRLASDRERFGG